MLFVYFKAPFGAFRIHQSVETLITADFLTHSSAYGLLLGLAGIEREEKHKYKDARIAVGMAGEKLPKHESVYQQLHMAIGNKADFERTKGTKPTIRPVVRELLIGLEGYIGLDCSELELLVNKGINQPESLHCWGIPFLGDNNFFLEEVKAQKESPTCRWFSPYNDQSVFNDVRQLHYMSVWTDYKTNAISKGLLFALSQQKEFLDENGRAWVRIGENL